MFRVIICLAILCPFNFYAQQPSLELPKLIVNGKAAINKPADEVRLKINIITQDPKTDVALRLNRERMHSMLESLKALGLSSKDYETEQFLLEPAYSIPPKNPPVDWKAEIIGYTVENAITVKTSQFDLAAAIIDQAGSSGASAVNILEFGIKDSRPFLAEAIEAAVRNAMSEAQVLAKAAGLRLKRILEINLEHVDGGRRPLAHRHFASKMYAMSNESSTPIEGGNIEFVANVHLVYEIEPLLK